MVSSESNILCRGINLFMPSLWSTYNCEFIVFSRSQHMNLFVFYFAYTETCISLPWVMSGLKVVNQNFHAISIEITWQDRWLNKDEIAAAKSEVQSLSQKTQNGRRIYWCNLSSYKLWHNIIVGTSYTVADVLSPM